MATKVKDGLFIGDAEASQDPEFIELNKITFVINCAGRQLPNLWEQHGLHYLTFPWTSDPDCTLFDGGNVVIEQITSFVDEAAGKGESVLVHSLEGTGRCIACVAAYLMFRHRWSFEKALDFLCNKRPDAAPNAGFVQQLYRLDLRLYEQWYGKSKEPTEDDRIRHDQWIPLVPGLAPGLQKRTHGRSPAGGQRPQSLALSGASQGKDAISTVIADAAAGCFGGAASTFPSLGWLTEAQEEEIVLVHSFLNSQPQIDALPPGRVDYEDHISKELHWVDRPRIDKLTAAGRLGRNNDRHQHMIPVSPRTGRAVPERPGNNSYNALSRGNKASATVPGTTPPVVGILKTTSAPKREANEVDGGGDKIPHSSPALEPKACELGLTPSGDTTAAVSGAGGAGGAPLTSSTLPPSRRRVERVGSPKVDDEVVVEDMSEPQSDRWGGTEGYGQSEPETVSGGELSSRSHAQGSALSPEDGADSSSSGEESKRTAAHSTAGGGSKSEHQGSSFKRGERDLHGPVTPARKEERQAWDGNSNNSGSSRGADTAGASETGGGYGTGRIGDSGGEAKGSDKAGVTPSRAKLIPASYKGDRNVAIRSKLDVGGRAIDAAAQVSAAVAAGRPALPISKQLRRGGSEGSLKSFPTEISARITTTPALAQDKARLPHASVGRATKNDKMSSNDSPGPGWGPDDIRRKDVGSGGERRLGLESALPAENGAYGKWQDDWERKTSGPTRLYPGADGGGSLQSLQQLAQTPNPQQRRLPSPRPQQELGQGDQRKGSSDAGSIFPQKRPSSAPSKRPDTSEDASSGGSGGGGSAAASPIPSSKAGAHRTRASSSVGAANQGYPAHGLMPSGSTVHTCMSANTDHGGRSGAVLSSEQVKGGSGSSTRPRYYSQAQEQPVGVSGSNSSSQRIVVTSFGNGGGEGGGEGGGGGGGGGRPSPSTEQSPQARMSPDEAMNAEQRVANAHGSRRDRGNNGGALPRGIRTSQPTAPPSVDSTQVRVGSPAPPPTSERALGANFTGSDHSRARGSRRSSGAASNAVASRTKTSGIMRPKAGTLPLPSRRGSLGDSRGGVDGGGKSGESARWANPAPRGRHGYGNGSSGTTGYPRCTDGRGGGGGGSVSSRAADAYTHLSHGGSPHRSNDGRGQQRHRAGGAPIYRSGSPAPVRGRKPSAASAASATATDPSRLVYQQRTRVVDNKPQAFGIAPAFRGYMASSGGIADGGGRGATARRSQVSSPSAKDRVRRASTGSDRTVSAVSVPRASFAVDRSEGQRPSTSEGLTGGSGAGRRGRSASPAPRPTSASGRRRSASPSPASLFTSKIDPSFDRPRWK